MATIKLHSYCFANKFFCMLIIALVFTVKSNSQTKDTALHQLQEVVIFENKQQELIASKKRVALDSSTLNKYNTTSLADLLANQSTIHIKSYGNGNIATTSMRGGNANHTALLWNGLNIQNAMLGQPDLSIIPTMFFNNVSLEYGGGSALWGSGAVGGSIHLQNDLRFSQGFKTKMQLSIASFDTRKIASSVLLSYKKLVSNTNVYYTASENNYPYKDTTDKENSNKQLTHSGFVAKGLMQELAFLATSQHRINIRLWYNITDRNIPSYTMFTSKQQQRDENLKLNADWKYNKNNLGTIIRLGYFNDKLNYNDSLANQLLSNSTIKTIIAESDNTYRYKNHTINFGANFTKYNSELYSSNVKSDATYHHTLTKFAIFAAYKLSLFQSKLTYNLVARKEFTDMTKVPLTGNTGLHYQFARMWSAKINGSKSFRQPTLNDLYWYPGGNPNLKPEESYEAEGGIEFKYSKKKLNASVEANYFNRHTTNWIMWLPKNTGFWSPVNIAEVYSRGTETKTEISYNTKDFSAKIVINTAYVLSTNQKKSNENDNSVGRQLIYTPRYTGQGTLIVQYKNISMLFNNHYTGYRFTSTDNTTWLNPYFITNFKCSYAYSFSTITMQLFASINNVFNKNYAVVQNRPMPMRNYEVGLSMSYYKPKKQNQQTNQ